MISCDDFEKKKLLFVFLNTGERISFLNDNVIVKDKDNNVKMQTTCYRIWALFIVGSFTITTGLIQRAKKFGFPILLLTHSLKFYERLGFYMEGNVSLRKRQYSYKELSIALFLIQNKISNQLMVLKERRNKDKVLKDTIEKLEKYQEKTKVFDGNLQELLGIEGNAAKIYFKQQFDNVDWHGRKPRVKSDYVNSCLDIGYSILFNIIESLLSLFGFDTYKGVLHTEFYMRKSLVCDIMEPFRPIIDIQLRKSINLKQIQPDDFIFVNHEYKLDLKSNKKIVSIFTVAIIDRKIEIFDYVKKYYRYFMANKEKEKFSDVPWFNVVKVNNGNS